MDQIGIWRLFIKEKDENDAFKLIKLIDFSNFQIANENLTLKEVPNIENCHELHITQFALTYNAYKDEELNQTEPWSGYSNAERLDNEYFNEGKHKNSLHHLRALLFFLQRQEHFSGPSENYIPNSKNIISDIIKLVK